MSRRARILAAGIALVCGAGLGVAGMLLVARPAADHAWLRAVERAAPVVRLAFLTRYERLVDLDSHDALARGRVELVRLERDDPSRAWSPEQRERAHELADAVRATMTGDAMVVSELTRHARGRQRFALGIPLVALGAALAWAGLVSRRAPID